MATLAADWSYQLGQAFLTAAVSCEGVECDRRFVSDGSDPESPPPGCDCQLVAIVSEGFEKSGVCGGVRVAEIRLVLDLCTVSPPEQTKIPDPAKVSAQAQRNASIRWLMMVGLRDACSNGLLTAWGENLGPFAANTCKRMTPGPWQWKRGTGGSARWESVWRLRVDV